MSQAHIEQFYKKAAADPALLQKLTDGANSPEEFIARAVAAAKAEGLQIEVAEATAWIEEQRRMTASGELSDAQLEGVAGGKGTKDGKEFQKKADAEANKVGNSNYSFGQQAGAVFKTTGYQWASWFTSW